MLPPYVLLLLFAVAPHVLTAALSLDPDGPDCQVLIAGAGIGGVYVAYRLVVDTQRFAGENVCIFEARPKPGGRILTVNGAVRGFKHFTVDLGAYRYSRGKQRFVTAVAEKLLNLSYICYADPLPDNYPECTSEKAKLELFTTRGKVFMPAGAALHNYSSDVPYNIPDEFQWGTNTSSLTSPRDPFSLLLSSRSPIRSIAERWDELLATTDYERAMIIVDEIINKLESDTYKGVPVSKVSLWQLAVAEGMTNEELKYFMDIGDIATNDALHSTVYENAVYEIRDIAAPLVPIKGPKGLVTPARVMANGVPRRIGMRSLVDGLLSKVQQAGVRVYYNTRVTHVDKLPYMRGMMQVTVNDVNTDEEKVIPSGNVFMNMQSLDVISLGMTSEPLKSGTRNFLRSFERMTPITLSKMYCFWDDAWWITKLNRTRGFFRVADGTIFTGRYHDGDVVCTDTNKTKCRGAMLVSYIAGGSATTAKSGVSLHAYNPSKFLPWRVDVKGNVRVVYNEGHNKLMFQDVHKQLRDAHRTMFEEKGLKVEKDLPDAKGCVYADWMDRGMHFGMGPIGPKVNTFRAFARPVEGLNLSLVNEAWSDYTGWAEGSIRSAERALLHVHGVEQPTWIDDPFYRSVIRKDNRG